MKETGELLKNRRLEKKLSLEEISSQTKIQLSILKNLEEGRLENLKNKTYTKGFLRQYAKALQMDGDELIALFEKETSVAVAAPTPEPVTALKAEDPIQEKTNVLWFRAPSKIITLAGVVMIVGLGTAIYFFSMKMASYSSETFKEDAAVETPAAEPTVQISTTPDPAMPQATPAPASETVVTEPAATTTAATEPSPAVPAPAPVPAPEPVKPAPAPTAAAKPVEAPAPAPAPAPKPKSVMVLATDSISIEASWSTGKKETIKLRSKSKHTFYYSTKITLLISNGGGANVTANNEDLGTPGEAGAPVTLSFD